jgi:hypothetical protein
VLLAVELSGMLLAVELPGVLLAVELPVTLLHDVMASPIPITAGSAKPPTLMCTFAAFRPKAASIPVERSRRDEKRQAVSRLAARESDTKDQENTAV